jgi:hypothetical protein
VDRRKGDKLGDTVTARIDRRSEAQLNADAIARRNAAYLGEHYASKRPRPRPRGLMELLAWFESDSVQEVWRRHGGGSRLGTLAWSDGFRRILEAPRSQDPEGFYLLPLAAALASIERRDSYMAAYLRAIALAGFEVSPVGMRAGLPESVAMVYAREALECLYRAYREEAPARLLTAAPAERVSSRASDELSPPDIAGRGQAPVPSDDQELRLSPSLPPAA